MTHDPHQQYDDFLWQVALVILACAIMVTVAVPVLLAAWRLG